jgi:hypothetical protein
MIGALAVDIQTEGLTSVDLTVEAELGVEVVADAVAFAPCSARHL